MSTKKNGTRTANDTATREEVTAVSTIDAATVATFRSVALGRIASQFDEASAYVASVDARGGKRGADAAVQKVIASGLEGLTDGDGRPVTVTPYSHARYSKLAGAFRAAGTAGFAVVSAAAFDALYALWNVSSTKLPSTERDAFVAGLVRRKSDETRLAAILAEVDTRKAREVKSEDDTTDGTTDDTTEEPTAGTITMRDAPTADDMLDLLASMFEVASELDDADRIRVAEGMRATADALAEAVTPAEVVETVAA